MGFDINNGIKPASKNISQDGIIEEETHERFYKWQVWGWTRFCNMMREGETCEKAKVTGVTYEILDGYNGNVSVEFLKDCLENACVF